jgi:N6-adenosine-specific RNA methylase IME4
MTAVELAVLPIRSLLANNAIAFIWTTGPQLEVTLKLLPFWGLKYKTVAFVWNKIKVNPGAYTMSQIEFVIAAIHGAIPKPRGARGVRQYLIEKRTTHSRKPSEIRDRIVKMFPTQRKLEMFAREAAAGWDRWGNEAPRGNGLISI